MRNTGCCILVGIIICVLSSMSFAWTTVNGVPICTANAQQTNPQITSDGDGGAIITWEDYRIPNEYNAHLYAQRVNSIGSTLWQLNGVVISTADHQSVFDQAYPQIISDGVNGALISWQDYRSGSFHIYSQRVDSTGATLWPENGVILCTTNSSQAYPAMISDGNSGALITWQHTSSGAPQTFAQRIDSNGTPLWSLDGVVISTSHIYQSPVITSDDSSGGIITWSYLHGYETLLAQRVDSNGTLLWPENGVTLCTVAASEINPSIVRDGAGGAIIVWEDYRNGTATYAQRVNSTGSTLWTTTGVKLFSGLIPAVVSDDSGGAIIASVSSGVLLAQRLNSNGSTLWTTSGVTITNYSSTNPKMSSDGAGGAIFSWQDSRGSNYDIYAQRVNSDGVTLWTKNGVAICTAVRNQLIPLITSNGNGGGVITWVDDRNGTTVSNDGNDIYAQSIYSQGLITPPPPPTFSTLPVLKLFSTQSLNNALYLQDYITDDIVTGYSIVNNFAGLVTLNGSTVNQGAYGSPTSGVNTFIASNSFGDGTADNKVKFSTYKIYKLPNVGLDVGSSWDFNVANYTYNSNGLAIPPSFGNTLSLNVSDLSKVTVQWVGDTIIRITSLQSFTGAVYVDVIASSTLPADSDQDKERISVYSNLLPHGTFSTTQDTTAWSPLELASGRSVLATQNWISNYTDSAGNQAVGVWQFTFPSGSAGVKATPSIANWINMTNGQWYTLRMRVVANTPNNHQSLLFGYNNLLGSGVQTDIAANVLFGIPTVWTWQETPLLVHGTTTTGYPQFQFKAGGAGSVYVDELQIINATPTLVDANRYITRYLYPYGDFDSGIDTTGWGQEVYTGAVSSPAISVTSSALYLNFSGATSGNQKGLKWTASNASVGAATFQTTPGREIGVRATVTKQSGNFNSLGIILVAAYGVQTSGQQTIGQSPSNILAAAGVGVLPGGTYRTVANAVNGYYQFQFGIRSDQSGILSVSDIDFDRDQDDPNYGDGTLFP